MTSENHIGNFAKNSLQQDQQEDDMKDVVKML